MFSRSCRFAACIVASVVLLAPCALAEEGAFEVYLKEQTLSRTRNAETWSAIPDEVRVRFSSCFAAAMVEGFTPDEISQLDMFDFNAPDPDLAVTKKALDRGRRLVEAIGSSDFSVFGSVCPNDIADFKNHSFCVRRECWRKPSE